LNLNEIIIKYIILFLFVKKNIFNVLEVYLGAPIVLCNFVFNLISAFPFRCN